MFPFFTMEKANNQIDKIAHFGTVVPCYTSHDYLREKMIVNMQRLSELKNCPKVNNIILVRYGTKC